ncbi:MAG TPA: hypothetical protein VFQ22_06315 [Longimicrobiales bacterium]|nr:hypothetical protein [Longimicrobiales bacterium]
MSAARHVAPVLALLAFAAGCASPGGPGAAAPVAAQLSVERFLQAANQRDVEAMGRLFGTADGPVLDTGGGVGCFFKKIGSWFGGSACVKRVEVEVRMDAIASIVRHDDYRIVREEPVPGRVSPTRRVYVDFTIDGRQVAEAPFLVVRTDEGRWLVEEVPLERIMAR